MSDRPEWWTAEGFMSTDGRHATHRTPLLPEFPMPRCRHPWWREPLLPRLERQGPADPHGLLPHLQAVLLRAKGYRPRAGPVARREGLLRPEAPPRGLRDARHRPPCRGGQEHRDALHGPL